jgi:hypothetical protein
VGVRDAGRRVSFGLGSLILLAGCASSASPSPSPLPSAIAFGEATLTESSLECTFDLRSDSPIQCATMSNDPRVSGDYTATLHTTGWNADTSHEAFLQWGTARLVNPGGAWDGPYSGIFATGRGDIITTWYRGSGGYAGMSYYQTITVAPTGGGWVSVGLIFPGSPPTP